jgi:hypothetical protein
VALSTRGGRKSDGGDENRQRSAVHGEEADRHRIEYDGYQRATMTGT